MSGKIPYLDNLNFVDLLHLPTELLLQIVLLLNLPDWAILRLTSKRFNFISQEFLHLSYSTYYYFPYYHQLFTLRAWKNCLAHEKINHPLLIQEFVLDCIQMKLNQLPQEYTIDGAKFWLNLWENIDGNEYLLQMEQKLSERLKGILTTKQIDYLFTHKQLKAYDFYQITQLMKSKYKHQLNYSQQREDIKQLERNLFTHSRNLLFSLVRAPLEPILKRIFKKFFPKQLGVILEKKDASEAINWSFFDHDDSLVQMKQTLEDNLLNLLKIGFLYKQFLCFIPKHPDKRFFYYQLFSVLDTLNIHPPLFVSLAELFYAQEIQQKLSISQADLVRCKVKPINIYWLQAKGAIRYHPSDLTLLLALSQDRDQHGHSALDWAKKLENYPYLHHVWKNLHLQITSKVAKKDKPQLLNSIVHLPSRMNALQWLILCQRPIRYLNHYFHLTQPTLAIITKEDMNRNTALHYAAVNKTCDWLGYLIINIPKDSLSYCLGRKNKEGLTPLLLAASRGNLINVELLLKVGAKIDKSTSSNHSLVHFLERFTPDENTLTYTTPLHVAAQFLSVYDFSILLNKWPQLLNQYNTEGNTALHLAVLRKHVAMTEFIISQGAKTNINNLLGLPPTAYARTQPLLGCFGLMKPQALSSLFDKLFTLGFNLNHDNVYTALKLVLSSANYQENFPQLSLLYQSYLRHVKEYAKPKNVYQFLHTIQSWMDSVDGPFKSYLAHNCFFKALQKLKKQLETLYEITNEMNHLPSFFNQHKKKNARVELLKIETAASSLLLSLQRPSCFINNEHLALIQDSLFFENEINDTLQIP